MEKELTELAEKVRTLRAMVGVNTEKVKVIRRDVVKHRIEIGKCLIRAKSLVKYGEFSSWLEREFAWSARSAQRYMRIAQKFGDMEIPAEVGVAELAKVAETKHLGIADGLRAKLSSGEPLNERDFVVPPKGKVLKPTQLVAFWDVESEVLRLFEKVAVDDRPRLLRRMVEMLDPDDRFEVKQLVADFF